jgi:hypothetical protein
MGEKKPMCCLCGSVGVYCQRAYSQRRVLGIVSVDHEEGRVKHWWVNQNEYLFDVKGGIKDCPVVKRDMTVARMHKIFQDSISRWKRENGVVDDQG